MPRNSRIPSYRLHKPSGQAVVTIGKDIYLGRFNSPGHLKSLVIYGNPF
jgi:hypothetical protein